MGGSCTKEKNIKDSIYEISNLGVKINDKEPKLKRNSIPEEVKQYNNLFYIYLT